MIQYFLSFIGKDPHKRLINGIGMCIFTIYAVSIVVNVFYPFLYYQDAFNVYHRGDGYWIATALGVTYTGLSYYIGIRSYPNYGKDERIIFLIYAMWRP